MPTLNYADSVRLGSQQAKAVHVSGYRVWPLPLPYLYSTGTAAFAQTPNAPDLVIDGDVRYASRVRLIRGSITAATFVQHGINSLAFGAEYRCDPALNNAWRISEWASGSQVTRNLVTNPELDSTYLPDGKDVRIGFTFTRPADRSRWAGIKSMDGSTWIEAGVPYVHPNQIVLAAPNTPLYIGQYWRGRIYWTQMEAINRAQLVFPGLAGNGVYFSDAPAFQLSGPIEMVVRAQLNWRDNVAPNTLAARYATTGLGGRSWYFYMDSDYPGRPRLAISADGSVGNTGTATIPVPFTTEMGWLKATCDPSTAIVKFFTSPDANSNIEPTGWTQLGGDRTLATTGLFAGTARVWLGKHDVSENGPLNGRIARFILRNGIGGPVVLDVSENNAGSSMATPSTFLATTGQTATVNQTAGNTIVQPQSNRVVWRFDARDVPVGAASYTDPRGRTWTLSNAGVILRPASIPDSEIIP